VMTKFLTLIDRSLDRLGAQLTACPIDYRGEILREFAAGAIRRSNERVSPEDMAVALEAIRGRVSGRGRRASGLVAAP
jgi:hypothetical protein